MTEQDIPADVMAVAESVALDIPQTVRAENRKFAALVIARAILAERERCAKIIDAANAHYAERHEAAKSTKTKAEARDMQTMRIATAGLSNLIRVGA